MIQQRQVTPDEIREMIARAVADLRVDFQHYQQTLRWMTMKYDARQAEIRSAADRAEERHLLRAFPHQEKS